MASRPILPLPSNFAQPSPPEQVQKSPPNPPTPPGPNKPVYAKRGKITIVACVPCRKRKTKCDGRRPACTQCQAREGQCLYDMTDDQRRLTFLRDNVEHLAVEKGTLESLICTLQTASEEDVGEVLRRLRSGTDVYAVAQQVHAGRLLADVRRDSPSSVTSSSGATAAHASLSARSESRVEPYESLLQAMCMATPMELDDIMRRLRIQEDPATILSQFRSLNLLQPISLNRHESDLTPSLETAYSKPDQTFGLVKGNVAAHASEDIEPRGPLATEDSHHRPQWTTVTDDAEFIEHLLSLYFSWQHTFFQNFPEKLFRADMTAGRTQYCSRCLVNAICAAGCLLSDRPEARRDPNDPRTAGLDFYDEAVRLLSETEHRVSSIPTAAALYLICHVEGNRGRLSALWNYSGQSARMALDINLHLRNDKTPTDRMTGNASTMESARCHAFWGCFHADQITSFTLGRVPQIPTSAITVDLPPVNREDDEEEWVAYSITRPVKPSAKSSTFHESAALSKIVNSTLLMFFAPTQIMSGGLLLNEYNKYLTWYKRLPSIVARIEDATPHVLCLHMYYHAAVLLLFRPFLKAKFTESDVSSWDVCRKSANAISDLFAQHRRLYDLTGLYTFQVHCLLTACTIHIINVPTISSTSYLTTACNSFQDLVHCNEWAAGSLNIIKGLVQKWNVILPLEAETALYRNEEMVSSFDFINEAEAYRPEKRAAFLNPSSQVMQKRQKLAPRETRETPTNYLFAPFPNQPAPLLGPIHTSTSADTEWNDELSKVAQGFDGLDFSGDDWFDPFMGYQGD